MKKRILISAGESSGDIHAANLIKELTLINSDLEFVGIGCSKMEAAGVELLERMDKHSIIGVWEIFGKLSFIKNLFDKFRTEIRRAPIELAILIDYPGFNLNLARMLHKENIPVIYYITPQVWAWGAWRIGEMKKCVNKAIVILNFEKSIYDKAGIPCNFIGHPIMDEPHELVPEKNAKLSFGMKHDKFTISLLAGSRPLEVKRILPVMLNAARIIAKEKNVQFLISKVPTVDPKLYDLDYSGINYKIVESDIYKVLSASDFVITASGTVTLQIAISEKPMVITYKTSPLTWFTGRMFVNLPYIGLVNILAGKHIVPEILQFEATPSRIAKASLDIIENTDRLNTMKKDLKMIKDSLGNPGASTRAAKIVNDFILTQ